MPEYICKKCEAFFWRRGTTAAVFCSRECRSRHMLSLEPLSVRTWYRRRRAAGLTNPAKRIAVNHEALSSWSSDLAYLMGLIWTDGCLTKGRITFNSKDREQAETFSRITGSPVRMLRGGLYFSCGIPAQDFILKQGLVERKSLVVEWPKSMPEHLSGDFMRGVFDGDGCVSLSRHRPGQQAFDLRASVYTASPRFALSICDWMDRSLISHSLYESRVGGPRKNPMYTVSVFRQESLVSLYHKLRLDGGGPFLSRKKARFDQWISSPRARSGRKRQNQ